MKEPVPGIIAIPDEQNARYFHVQVDGPKDVSLCVVARNTRGSDCSVVVNCCLKPYSLCEPFLFVIFYFIFLVGFFWWWRLCICLVSVWSVGVCMCV